MRAGETVGVVAKTLAEDGRGWGKRLRKRSKSACRLGSTVALLRCDLQRKGQVSLARNANLAAYQPVDMGGELGGEGALRVEPALRVMGKSTSSS